jgi:acyl carrier protein
MTNLERYNTVFTSVFNVELGTLNAEFSSETVDNWDSITQLSLVTEIEDEFDIMLDTEDILEFKSYEIGKKIVSKYDIEL